MSTVSRPVSGRIPLKSLSAALFLSGLVLAGHAIAATFTVTNLNESGAGSLADAVAQANTAGATNSITFQSGLSGTISYTTATDSTYGAAAMVVTCNLTITGPSGGVTLSRSSGNLRFFNVTGSLTVDSLTFANGAVQGGNGGDSFTGGGGGGGAGMGGAIFNGGTLTVTRCLFRNNAASGGAGGNGSNSGGPGGGGGGLYGRGGNASTYAGGGGGGTGGNGGNAGADTSGHGAGGGGGGANLGENGQDGTAFIGGAGGGTAGGRGADNGQPLGSTSGTSGGGGGGACAGGYAYVGGFGGGGGGTSAGVFAGTGGFGAGGGGGAAQYGGTGGFGGGGGGCGGAGYSGTGGFGGGMGTGQGGGGAGMGGAIFNYSGTLSISNSTFTANTTTGGTGGNTGGAYGGAIFTYNGTVTLLNVTISSNTAGYGRAFYAYGSTHTINNSILSQTDSSVSDLAGASGATINGSANLIRSIAGGYTCNLTSTIMADPLLGALAANGGPTQSLLPQNGSPASGTGNDAAAGSLTYDQRGAGYPRVLGTHVDIGAIEFCTIPYFILTYSAGANGSLTGTASQTVQQGNDGSAVTAAPAAGYHFVQWSDISTANPRTDTNVAANVTVTASFAINTYTLTYSAGANGSLTGTTSQTVNHGTDGTALTAVPAAHYHFVQWSDSSTANPRTDTNVQANVNVTASFALDTFALTYNAGANGSLTGTASQTVNYGADGTTITAAPAAGYHFVKWSDNSTDNPRTDTNVQANVNVTASFAINTYTLIYSAGANGSLTGTTSQTVNHGTDGTAITAVPAAHYHFVKWSDNSTDNPRTDTNVQANVSVTASFAIDTFTLTYSAGANGSITGTASQTVNYGTNGSAVTAVPAAHYHFVQWSDNSTDNPRTDTNVQANVNVTASFAIDTCTLTYSAGANGSLTGTASQTVNYGTDGTAITAVPAAHYHFVQWSDSSTDNPRTDTNVQANITVTASFAIDTFTITYSAGTNGSLTGTASQTVNYNTGCTAVTAVPSRYCHFVNWTGPNSFTSTNNPLTIQNVIASATYTAHFAVDTRSVTFMAGANGSLTGSTPQTVNYGGNCMAVTAMPAVGYHFVNWTGSGDFTSTDNPLTVTNVTNDAAYTANFAIDTPTVAFAADANGSLNGTTSQTLQYGQDCTAVTAVPAVGYHFVRWTGPTGFASTDNPLTIANVTGDATYTAHFAIMDYAVTFTADAHGTLSGSTSQAVEYGGDTVAVTAVPADGYCFENWTVDGSEETYTDNPLTITNVTGAMTIAAHFVVSPQVQVTVQADSGAVDPTSGDVNIGDQVPFTININNVGAGDATDVRILMPLPDNTEFVSGSVETASSSRSIGQVSVEDGNIVISLPTLDAGQAITVHLVLRAVATGQIVLTPSAQTAEQPAITPAGDAAEVPVDDPSTQPGGWQPSRICGAMGFAPLPALFFGLLLLKLAGSRGRSYVVPGMKRLWS